MTAPIKLSSRATREFWEIPVLYEDDLLLAIDKPSGLLVSPDRLDPERPNLMRLLQASILAEAPWAKSRGLTYLTQAHRLDSETSGVLLLAKSKAALVHLANQFGSEKTVRSYVALVQGVPVEKSFRVDMKLAPHPVRPDLVRVDPRSGKKATTLFEVQEVFAGYSLLRCRPMTDRPHQIRAHLRHFALPLAGDNLYGGRPLLLSRLKPGYRFKEDREELPLMGRPGLHAEELTVLHPGTGQSVVIHAPWPKDFNVAVKYLRRYSPGGAASNLAVVPDPLTPA